MGLVRFSSECRNASVEGCLVKARALGCFRSGGTKVCRTFEEGHRRHTESASPRKRWHAALRKSRSGITKKTKISRISKTQQFKELANIDMSREYPCTRPPIPGTGDSPTVHRQRLSQPLVPNTEPGRSPRLLCNTKCPNSVDGTRAAECAARMLMPHNQRRHGARCLHTTAHHLRDEMNTCRSPHDSENKLQRCPSQHQAGSGPPYSNGQMQALENCNMRGRSNCKVLPWACSASILGVRLGRERPKPRQPLLSSR